MPNRANIKQGKEQENLLPNNRYKVFFLLPSLIIAAGLLLAVSFRTPQAIPANQKITARQTYLDILGEPHTGLRLARLKDFIAHTPPNADTHRAKTGRDTLDVYEQNDWAHLTDFLYDIGKTPEHKNRAIADYKANWGVWNRQAELPKLRNATGLAETQPTKYTSGQMTDSVDGQNLPNYSPSSRNSQYAKGRAEDVLAGETFTNITVTNSTVPNHNIPQPLATAQNRPVRVKFAKRPRYPRTAFRKGISGQITLALDINERGHVVRTTVISAKAPRYKDKFIRAARRAAMASKFHPKTEAGRAVATSRYVRKYKFTAGS